VTSCDICKTVDTSTTCDHQMD